MTVDEIMNQLEEMGSEQTKKTYIRHGAKEPFFGVKVGDLKKLVKYVKKDQELALALYDTGNHDAMYLAGLGVDPKKLTRQQLEHWVEKAYWYMLAEYTVANVAAESPFALELARKWMDDEREMVAACGWSTYAGYLSITQDEELNLEEIRGLLKRVEETINGEQNRVRYVMNGFVIVAGSAVSSLHDEALAVAERVGKVDVNAGNTACKVPLATDYILKVKNRGKVGVKKKTCIC
ncbi:DNA alkylation repair protein [Fictibacillus fluitans]|uniref:DNA alkylation repair protein n=1 Tax=Fictibacillus fluitans TaxID=3058422 RepID=A0ABT8HY70_9BACL|nr:DNA alkylation repair protein [Fictibacillus sp. NE201]MDN4525717.1 DNA alkylation repair protein [Fictibacillus sp. NE201]